MEKKRKQQKLNNILWAIFVSIAVLTFALSTHQLNKLVDHKIEVVVNK